MTQNVERIITCRLLLRSPRHSFKQEVGVLVELESGATTEEVVVRDGSVSGYGVKGGNLIRAAASEYLYGLEILDPERRAQRILADHDAYMLRLNRLRAIALVDCADAAATYLEKDNPERHFDDDYRVFDISRTCDRASDQRQTFVHGLQLIWGPIVLHRWQREAEARTEIDRLLDESEPD